MSNVQKGMLGGQKPDCICVEGEYCPNDGSCPGGTTAIDVKGNYNVPTSAQCVFRNRNERPHERWQMVFRGNSYA